MISNYYDSYIIKKSIIQISAFFVLGVGSAVGFLILIFEILIYKCMKRQ